MGFPLNLDTSPHIETAGSTDETGGGKTPADDSRQSLSQEYSGTKITAPSGRLDFGVPIAGSDARQTTLLADAGQDEKPDPLNDPTKTWEQKYEAVEGFIRDNYYPKDRLAASNFYELDKKYLGHIKTEADYVEAIKAETQTLNDPWTEFKTTAEIAELSKNSQDGLRSSGIWVKKQGSDTVIEALLWGFPAYKSDLRIGDKLTSINGKSIDGMSLDQIEPLLEGQQGQTLNIGFETPEGEKRQQSLLLQPAHEMHSSAEIIQDPSTGKNVLHLGMLSFDREADDELESAIQAIPKDKLRTVSGIVFDLRGNEGGLLPPIRRTADMFVPPGDLFRIDARDGIYKVGTMTFDESDYTLDAETRGMLRKLPMAILINGTTRSAPETLTASLRENGRLCAVVGEKSYGKDIVFDNYDVAGGNLKMTFEELKTLSGYAWQGKGLQPDVVVANKRGADAPDDQLSKAVQTVISAKK